MKKVLLITYYFPPIGGGGVQRSAKLAQFLPEFGWFPYVISTSESVGGEGYDHSLLNNQISEIEVKRVPTPYFLPLTSLFSRFPLLKHFFTKTHGIVNTILRALFFPLSLLEAPPVDPMFWWSLRIIPLALKMIKKYDIDVVYTSSSPWSVLITGFILKTLTRIPWVADMRDAWTQNTDWIIYSKGWRRKLDCWLELRLLASCDHIVAAFCPNGFLRVNKSKPKEITVIYNGFDSSDFETLRESEVVSRDLVSRPIRIRFLGTMYEGMADAFFEAFALLPEHVLENICVEIIGYRSEVAQTAYQRYHMRAKVTFCPPVSHVKALQLMREAHVLLFLTTPTSYGEIAPSGKVFEYIASGTPILAITSTSAAAAEIVRSTRTGIVVSPHETLRIADVLNHIATDYQNFREQNFRPNENEIRRYERREAVKEFVGVFDKVCSNLN